MFQSTVVKWILLYLVISPTIFIICLSDLHSNNLLAAKRKRMSERVRKMFYHAYDNYMMYAFPHDELKPLTKTFTDSLSELGNLKLEHLPQQYNGSALTLIESLSSLVILGNYTEFEKAIIWLSENLSFDVDARVNLFEVIYALSRLHFYVWSNWVIVLAYVHRQIVLSINAFNDHI